MKHQLYKELITHTGNLVERINLINNYTEFSNDNGELIDLVCDASTHAPITLYRTGAEGRVYCDYDLSYISVEYMKNNINTKKHAEAAIKYTLRNHKATNLSNEDVLIFICQYDIDLNCFTRDEVYVLSNRMNLNQDKYERLFKYFKLLDCDKMIDLACLIRINTALLYHLIITRIEAGDYTIKKLNEKVSKLKNKYKAITKNIKFTKYNHDYTLYVDKDDNEHVLSILDMIYIESSEINKLETIKKIINNKQITSLKFNDTPDNYIQFNAELYGNHADVVYKIINKSSTTLSSFSKYKIDQLINSCLSNTNDYSFASYIMQLIDNTKYKVDDEVLTKIKIKAMLERTV